MSISCPIVFDSIQHRYTRTEDAKIFTSVTTFISQFKPQIDFTIIAERTAQRRGETKEQVLAEWDAIKMKGTDFGTAVHADIKNYLDGGKCSQDILQFLNKMKTDHDLDNRIIHSEKMVYDMDHHIAGTADLIAEHKGGEFFDVIDYKTNKKFSYSASRWDNNHFSPPISHLPCNEYFTYALQLSLYAYIFTKMTGKKPANLVLYWCKRKNIKTYTCAEGIWKKIAVPYLEEEIVSLLNTIDGKKISIEEV